MLDETSIALPLHFTEWSPLTQAAVLAVATFVQEDIPTVSAAILAAAGRLSWSAGFFGCFLGIWMGDALLYLAARGFGRPLLRWAWVRRLVPPDRVARSEIWFAERGAWLLVSSRFVPGTRLPTYLAAGFLRHSFGHFLLVTGVTVAVWTLAIFGLAHVFGSQFSVWMQRWSGLAWLLPVLVLAGLILLRLARRLPWKAAGGRLATQAGRWKHWEFWPAWLFYLPVVLRYAQLAVRYRGITLPSAANPGIRTGGLVGESKFETLRELFQSSPEFTAQAWLLPAVTPETTGPDRRSTLLRQLCIDHDIPFPFILKPDVGQRGAGVKLIRSPEEADACLRANSGALVLQRYVPGPLEAGVFYYRHPGEESGHLFAITEKIFPILTGDGRHTVEELIHRDARARFVADRYVARFASRRADILAPGETLRLVEAGNHAQGCIFRDGSQFLTPELAARMDDISRKLTGFFIGRYDIRFGSEEDLRAGRNFQILELNGAASEATSIYDVRTPLSAAYRTLFRQWELVFAIGAANRARGTRSTPVLELLRIWHATHQLIATYPIAD